MTVIPIDENDIAPARALRTEFARFWSTAQGKPRDVYDEFIRATPAASGVATRSVTDDPGPGRWCEPADAQPGRVILFLHGGSYVLGHTDAYSGLVSQIAVRARVSIFALEYPLAPEATLPVSRDLAVRTIERLTARFSSVAIVGDSAGGGLSLATAFEARRRGIPVSAIVAFSPWTDLSLSGSSVFEFAVGDPLLDVASLRESAAAYLGTASATDPRASPLFDREQLSPILLHVGSDEILRDDSRRFAEAASKTGTEVMLEEWQGMHHVFVLNTQQLASARRALDHAAAFLEKHWNT
jgi:epsilon-lactone hydrolase